MNPERAPASTRTGDDTRARILDTARELFGKHGFDGTTIRQISEAVGLTDAALYYHFKSKREILNAVWDVPLGSGPGTFRAQEPFDEERLDAIVDAAVDFSITNDNFLRLMCREILSGDQTASALRQQNRAIIRRVLHEHFLTRLGPAEAEIRSEAIMALVTGASMRLQIEAGPDYANEAASESFRVRLHEDVRTLARLSETATLSP